ncbi:DUF4194 domain-containing protein [Castellaniella sp.]|uniref:DUF4194 domain-containing protein n=1 Tax=Castellaniella sp. TaxID=1955812 RepID=UPI003565F5FC
MKTTMPSSPDDFPDGLDAPDDSGALERNAPSSAVPELSRLMVHLLKGVLYRQDDPLLWSSLMGLQARVREQAAVLLLDLVLDEAEGYAYFRGRATPEEGDARAPLPRLVARRALSYPVSLMLALLRKRMAESDAGGGDTRLVLSREDIVELIRVFLPDGSNEARLIDQVDATIGKVVELGFLRRLKPTASPGQQARHYEVRRIIKAFVDAQWLAGLDAHLASYQNLVAGHDGQSDVSEASEAPDEFGEPGAQGDAGRVPQTGSVQTDE